MVAAIRKTKRIKNLSRQIANKSGKIRNWDATKTPAALALVGTTKKSDGYADYSPQVRKCSGRRPPPRAANSQRRGRVAQTHALDGQSLYAPAAEVSVSHSV